MIGAQQFGVYLRRANCEPRYCEVVASSRALAANAAEKMAIGFEAYAVTQRSDVVGRCCRCRGVVFKDQLSADSGGGMPRCAEC